MSRNASPLTATVRNDSIIYYIYAQKPRFIVYIIYRVCVCIYRTGLFNFPPSRSPIGYRRSRIVDVRRFGNKKKSRKTSRACECTYTMTVTRHYPTYANEEILYIYKHAYAAHCCKFNIYIGYSPLHRHRCSYIRVLLEPYSGFLYFFSVYLGSVFIFHYADKMETYISYIYK